MRCLLYTLAITMIAAACQPTQQNMPNPEKLLEKYTEFTLRSDLSGLSDAERKMIPILIDAAKEMEKVFWIQAYGEKEEFLGGIENPSLRRFAEINFGPWDRLDGNAPFIPGVEAKPAGANFYPKDLGKEEFEAWDNPLKNDLYTIVRRNAEGELEAVPYHIAFADYHTKAAQKLREAASIAPQKSLKNYLELRAEALESGVYQPSDLAWMDMKDNVLDVVIGPIENYEDQLFGYKAANEAFVLIKDVEWSARLEKYTSLLPELQRNLPVDEVYKSETPGSESDLNAYDVIYYAGDSNAGSKTIAINLPNDEEVQLTKGTRRLQLKNAMQAKFEKIMLPITDVLIAEDQRSFVTFDAFFGNTMFHEVAHGLGIKNTINGRGTVREALKNHAPALEEGKADVLGLYMVKELRGIGEITEGSLKDNMVTFLAGIFRSIRFGSSSAHGRANLIRFNFFKELGAFTFDSGKGVYAVDFEKMEEASNILSARILELQGNGDYEAVDSFVKKYAVEGNELKASLQRLTQKNIPVDIIFNQGVEVLGLN